MYHRTGGFTLFMLPDQIETGVDKLVELVRQKGRISVPEAARVLGVGPMVVQELAAFLEEEGLVGVEYTLRKVFLVANPIAPRDVHARAKQVAQQKDIFIHNVDNALVQIERDALNFSTLKQEFSRLEADLGGDLDKIKKQIQELAGFDSLKDVCDKKICAHEKQMQSMISRSDERIQRIEKRHQAVADAIERTKRGLTDHQKNLLRIEQQRATLHARLEDFARSTTSLQERMNQDTQKMQRHISALRKLEAQADAVRKETAQHKERVLLPLKELSEKHETRIKEMHTRIVSQAKDVHNAIKRQAASGQEATKQFLAFFDKRIQVDNLLERISAKQEELKRSLASLKRKGFALSITARALSDDEMAMLEKKLKTVEIQRTWLQNEIQKLSILLKQ
jgi:chromosome segregation ATPase